MNSSSTSFAIVLFITLISLSLFLPNPCTAQENGWPEGILLPGSVEADNRILLALEKNASIDFFEWPMEDVAKRLARAYEIDVSIHESATEYGLDKKTIIVAASEDRSLAATLQTLVEPYRCTIMLKDEALQFVSNDYAQSHPMEFTFDLNQIVKNTEGEVSANMDLVVQMIQDTVDPDSWVDVGGEGVVRAVDTKLTVRQSLKNLRTIHQLLCRCGEPNDAKSD